MTMATKAPSSALSEPKPLLWRSSAACNSTSVPPAAESPSAISPRHPVALPRGFAAQSIAATHMIRQLGPRNSSAMAAGRPRVRASAPRSMDPPLTKWFKPWVANSAKAIVPATSSATRFPLQIKKRLSSQTPASRTATQISGARVSPRCTSSTRCSRPRAIATRPLKTTTVRAGIANAGRAWLC